MFVKEGGVLLLLKKTHTLFFFLSARLSVAFFFANSCTRVRASTTYRSRARCTVVKRSVAGSNINLFNH